MRQAPLQLRGKDDEKMSSNVVETFYDQTVEQEWLRLERHPFEFAVNRSYMDRYIQPGDRVLDIGGGPGRYSLYLAEKGCQVTLLDLSGENIRFAQNKAEERGLKIQAVQADARKASQAVEGDFDHVLLMGPLYHLLTLEDRHQAVKEALACLKTGGTFFASFIQMNAGLTYIGVNGPETILDPSNDIFLDNMKQEESYAGPAFTDAYFAQRTEAEELFRIYPLQKLHMLGSEGVASPFEPGILEQSPQVRERWLDVCLGLCEQTQLISFSEHLMYVGRKMPDPEVVLETDRLILRDFRMSDFTDVHEYGSDLDTVRFVLPKPNTEEVTRNYLYTRLVLAHQTPRMDYDFAVTLKESGKVIAGMGFYRSHSSEEKEAEIGWMMNRKYHHQGYAQEAAKEIIRFGFESLGLDRIYARCDRENEPSWRLMERCGMKREGCLRKNKYNEHFVEQPYRDTLFYGILKEEWSQS